MENINLSEFGVEKLNSNEVTKINGGRVPWGPIIEIALEVIDHWDEIKRGYNEEMNSGG